MSCSVKVKTLVSPRRIVQDGGQEYFTARGMEGIRCGHRQITLATCSKLSLIVNATGNDEIHEVHKRNIIPHATTEKGFRAERLLGRSELILDCQYERSVAYVVRQLCTRVIS